MTLLVVLYAASVTTLSAAIVLHRWYRFDGMPVGFLRALVWQGVIYFTWAAATPLIAWAGRRFVVGSNPWLRSLPAYIAASVVLVPAHALLVAFTTWIARPVPPAGRGSWQNSWGALVLERLPIDLLIYWAIVGALYALVHYRALRQQERAAAAMETQLARAGLHALSSQLQPHFLFNALQGISTLVRRRPDDAVRMIAHLGDLLRETLRRAHEPEVPLREEVALLRHYLAIEQIRLGNRLHVTFDVEPAAQECSVPGLLLQPIVENAVRHGLSEKPEGGCITIRASVARGRLRLSVEDSGVGLPSGNQPREGVGLSITRERLEQLHGVAASFSVASRAGGEGVLVTIELPCRSESSLIGERT